MARVHLGPPAGSGFLYEVFNKRVEAQLSSAESLDAKLGVAIAALIAVAGAVYASRPPVLIAALMASWLLVGLIQAIRGFSYDDRFADGPDAAFLRSRESLDPEVIRWHSSVVLEASIELNRPRLATKGIRLNQVVLTLGLVAAVALIAKAIGIA